MIRAAFALLAVSLAACVTRDAGAPEAVLAPESAGISSARLARLTERMREFEKDERISGVVTLVSRSGRIVHADALGFQDVEARIPMRRDTLFRIASMTKPITSVATLILVEEGKFALSDPVDRWLPELANPKVLRDPAGSLARVVPSPRPITVRDLLTHRSGLTYTFTSTGPLAKELENAGLVGWSSSLSPDEWMKRLGGLPLAYAPGTRWNYGLSTDVLGVLVERASGVPFPEFLRTRIFEPLGMKDTAFWVPAEKVHRLAVLYALDPRTGERRLVDHPSRTKLATRPSFAAGGGGLVSTADDYLRFGRMLLGRGELDGVRILSRKTVALMTTNHLAPDQRKISFVDLPFFAGQGFGLGVYVVDDPTQVIGSELKSAGTHGWGGAHGTWYLVDPQEELVAVMMIQLTGGGQAIPMIPAFETAIYQALED